MYKAPLTLPQPDNAYVHIHGISPRFTVAANPVAVTGWIKPGQNNGTATVIASSDESNVNSGAGGSVLSLLGIDSSNLSNTASSQANVATF